MLRIRHRRRQGRFDAIAILPVDSLNNTVNRDGNRDHCLWRFRVDPHSATGLIRGARQRNSAAFLPAMIRSTNFCWTEMTISPLLTGPLSFVQNLFQLIR
jgi:hypothetical protein